MKKPTDKAVGLIKNRQRKLGRVIGKEGNMDQDSGYKDAWNKAIQLLSRREYSRKELERKLSEYADSTTIQKLLCSLENDGYLSDQRFCESFIRMRCGQGHGLIRINFDLRQKGISSELIAHCLEELAFDWFELALEQYQRKYQRNLVCVDYKERAKRTRFMAQRGFSMDQIKYAIENAVQYTP